ncbi:MAG TPA: DinB family protein [Candidatus Eisenbacteria bacterium]|nr:DinB family protein [Candidatus Eisenbacteria bacterium]
MTENVAQCRYLMSLVESVLAGLDDSHRALEPQPGVKTAGWLIGHMAVSGDYARRLCGRDPLCPPAWSEAFNPGTQPSHHDADYPPMAELCAALHAVYDDLCEAAEQALPAALDTPNPFLPAQAAFPTAGGFVGYLLTSHLAYHMGQLVAWRGAAGLGRLARPEALAA